MTQFIIQVWKSNIIPWVLCLLLFVGVGVERINYNQLQERRQFEGFIYMDTIKHCQNALNDTTIRMRNINSLLTFDNRTEVRR